MIGLGVGTGVRYMICGVGEAAEQPASAMDTARPRAARCKRETRLAFIFPAPLYSKGRLLGPSELQQADDSPASNSERSPRTGLWPAQRVGAGVGQRYLVGEHPGAAFPLELGPPATGKYCRLIRGLSGFPVTSSGQIRRYNPGWHPPVDCTSSVQGRAYSVSAPRVVEAPSRRTKRAAAPRA